MTTRIKPIEDESTAEAEAEPAKVEEQTPRCGAPHFLPALAGHVHCTEPAQDPDRAPGTPDHQHRHQDGDAIYLW
ncbi:hypothetical protein ABT076_10560 [Streptomyces sp. NPDC002131]|uniref:hypothetical protein n=1 Tax=Streptomyces sp. NPDC002131 TaxID=3154535 RepID=UPI00332AA8B5